MVSPERINTSHCKALLIKYGHPRSCVDFVRIAIASVNGEKCVGDSDDDDDDNDGYLYRIYSIANNHDIDEDRKLRKQIMWHVRNQAWGTFLFHAAQYWTIYAARREQNKSTADSQAEELIYHLQWRNRCISNDWRNFLGVFIGLSRDVTHVHVAAYLGLNQSLSFLLERLETLAPVTDLQDKRGYTPLHYAVKEGHATTVELLLKQPGIQINCKDKAEQTPLHLAARYGHVKTVSRLLRQPDVDIDVLDINGNTPFLLAVYRDNIDAANPLLEHGAHLHHMNERGETVVHLACCGRAKIESMKFLLELGADVDARDNYGRTALHRAADSRVDGSIIKLLLTHGLDINAKDEKGETPLFRAVKFFDTSAVAILPAYSADTSCRNVDGKTALDIALRYERTEITEELRQHARLIEQEAPRAPNERLSSTGTA